jgi:hypothetical protein
MNRLSHMLGMYLQIALRNLLKNKVFSLINMTGLALGAACSLMIGLAVQDETSLDQFLKDKDRRFAVYQREYADGQVTAGYATPAQLGEELKRVIPEIQYAANTEQDFNAFRVNYCTKAVTMRGAIFFRFSDFLSCWVRPARHCKIRKAPPFPGRWPLPASAARKRLWAKQ